MTMVLKSVMRRWYLIAALPMALTAQPAANAGRITGFSPASGEPGTLVTLNGQNFNRNRSGAVWSGATPPYLVGFPGSRFNILHVTPTFVSATQLRVTVPPGARTGKINLSEAVQGGMGSEYGYSPSEFVVVGSAVAHFVNDSSLALVSLTSAGAQALPPGGGALKGQSVDVPLTATGTFTFTIGLGNLLGTTPNASFLINRTVTLGTGATTVAITNPSIGQVLTLSRPSPTTWQSDTFLSNTDGQLHMFRLVVNDQGAWTMHVDSSASVAFSGTSATTLWPQMTSLTGALPGISFRLSGLPNNPTAQMAFPYSSFMVMVGNQVRQFTKQ